MHPLPLTWNLTEGPFKRKTVFQWGSPQEGCFCGPQRSPPNEDPLSKRYKLDCYWAGSLDFHFLGNQGAFRTKPPNMLFVLIYFFCGSFDPALAKAATTTATPGQI